jgi:hypothetical protein
MSQAPKQDHKTQDEEISKALNYFANLRYTEAVQGERLSDPSSGQVVEHITPRGDALAIKAGKYLHHSEGIMMHYAATHGVRAPKVRGTYDIHGIKTKRLTRAMVSERVPGVPLVDVWESYNATDKSTVIDQLREQLACMRACTQPYIGRTGHQKVANGYDLSSSLCGPFADEEAFDDWCLGYILQGPFMQRMWKQILRRDRKQRSSTSFVLTHGDLSPRNILAQGNVITGTIDWEYSGFYPEYAEYAFSAKVRPQPKWWIEVLKDLLPPCSKRRLMFSALVHHGIVMS